MRAAQRQVRSGSYRVRALPTPRGGAAGGASTLSPFSRATAASSSSLSERASGSPVERAFSNALISVESDQTLAEMLPTSLRTEWNQRGGMYKTSPPRSPGSSNATCAVPVLASAAAYSSSVVAPSRQTPSSSHTTSCSSISSSHDSDASSSSSQSTGEAGRPFVKIRMFAHRICFQFHSHLSPRMRSSSPSHNQRPHDACDAGIWLF
jgi:hypothetical protein